MELKWCIYFILSSQSFSIVLCRSTCEIVSNKPSRVAKIEYGKHYVTRMFPSVSDRINVETAQNNKKRIKVKRIRKTSETIVCSTHETTTQTKRKQYRATKNRSSRLYSTFPTITTKYTIHWGRYTTNYKGAVTPYPLRMFPEILVEKHNLTKWWHPHHTEWFNLFDVITERTKYFPFTIRVYPFKKLNAKYRIPVAGYLNDMLRNYAKTTPETQPPHWIDRKYWEVEYRFESGPLRAYRPRHFYDERNTSCRHHVITNTLTPYTGSPCIQMFDIDNYEFDDHYNYDDSRLYSEDARLADKFGSNNKDSLSSEMVDEGPHRLLKGREYNSIENSESDQLTVVNLEVDNTRITEQLLNENTKLNEQTEKMHHKRFGNRTDKELNETKQFLAEHLASDIEPEDLDYILPEYLNLGEKEDIEARKAKRRQLRTICGKLISTIKKKLNTIWWKTFWQETITTPTIFKAGKSTMWYTEISLVKRKK